MHSSPDNQSEIQEIPLEITSGKVIFMKKTEDNGRNLEICGVLENPPIEVGKAIKLSRGNTTIVETISQENEIYLITTESGSLYKFDPSQILDHHLPPEDLGFVN